MNGARVGGSVTNYTFRPAINTVMTTTKHVLIVDDEADICLLLSGLLRRLGYQPTCAHFLEEGRQCLSRQHFDAIFLDLNLPDGIGFDLLPIIKTGQALVDSPKVVMISAFDGMAERKRASDQGADYFMGKPFTRKTVEQALESIQL
jgi:two-component system, OmpR family, response regulator